MDNYLRYTYSPGIYKHRQYTKAQAGFLISVSLTGFIVWYFTVYDSCPFSLPWGQAYVIFKRSLDSFGGKHWYSCTTLLVDRSLSLFHCKGTVENDMAVNGHLRGATSIEDLNVWEITCLLGCTGMFGSDISGWNSRHNSVQNGVNWNGRK